MASKQQTTVNLTEKAQLIKVDLAPLFGLKNILSAGLILMDRLSADEQKAIIAEANGIEYVEPAEKAAFFARWCIKLYQDLSSKNFAVSLQFLSDEESKAVREMLNAINPEIQYLKTKKRKRG